jgi:serine/threonine protein kinase
MQGELLPADEVWSAFVSVLLAVGHLHQHGVVHHNVKMANVLNVGGTYKLTDHGSATWGPSYEDDFTTAGEHVQQFAAAADAAAYWSIHTDSAG